MTGAALIVSTSHLILFNSTQDFSVHRQKAVFTPIQLPKISANADKPKRNPFLMPVTQQRQIILPAPVPVLKGIVQSGSAYIALIEYSGQSGYYRSGNKTGGYTVGKITAASAELHNGKETLTLKAGGAAHD